MTEPQPKNTDEEKYIKGFNEGYLLTEYLPDLSEKLAKLKAEGPQLQGFRDGRQEYLDSREKDKIRQTDKSEDKETDKKKTLDLEPPPPGWTISRTFSKFFSPDDKGLDNKQDKPDKDIDKPRQRPNRGREPEL